MWLWRIQNWYAYFFGFPFLAPLHHLFGNLALHGLGYDNENFSGEEWFIRKLKLENPEICFDVGANEGRSSKVLLKHLNARVYAFEPSSSFSVLSKIADARLTSMNSAVGDFDGTTSLFGKSTTDGGGSMNATIGGSDERKVPITTLDSFVERNAIQRVDFIKIDVEGFEAEVFKGAQKTIQNLKPRYIQFEFDHHDLYRGITLFSLTQQLPGYEFYRLLPHGWIKIDPTKQANNIFMFCNIVAKSLG